MSFDEIDSIVFFLINGILTLMLIIFIVGYVAYFYPPIKNIKNHRRRLAYIFFYIILIMLGVLLFFKAVELKTIIFIIVLALVDAIILNLIDDSKSLPIIEVNKTDDDLKSTREEMFDEEFFINLSLESLEKEYENIQSKIDEMETKLHSLNLGGFWNNFLIGDPLSPKEEEHNRELYNKISYDIRELELQKSELERKIEELKNSRKNP